MARDKTVSVRVTEEKFELYKATAEALNCKVSELVRASIDPIAEFHDNTNEETFSQLLDNNNPESLSDLTASYLSNLSDMYENTNLPAEAVKGGIRNHTDMMINDESYREFHVQLQEGKYESFREILDDSEDMLESQTENQEAYNEVMKSFGAMLTELKRPSETQKHDPWEEVDKMRDQGYEEAAVIMTDVAYLFDE